MNIQVGASGNITACGEVSGISIPGQPWDFIYTACQGKYKYINDTVVEVTGWTEPVVSGIGPTGELLPPPTPEEILAAKEQQITNLRAQAYMASGIDALALAVAAWEKVVENRPEAADAIEAIRSGIKEYYPKPS